MIDPLQRWREHGEKPDYAGPVSFGSAPYTQDAALLAGFDVAIVGAPTDDLVSDRPGTRFGPRAIRAASCPSGPHLEAGVDAFAELRVVDFGDAAVLPADAAGTHAAIEKTVGEVLDAGLLPIVLGGDHSIAEPDVGACAHRHGAVGLVHFDAHADTGRRVFGVEVSHGTPMYRLVRDGHVDPRRYVQIGLRATGPARPSSPGRRSRGSPRSSCTTSVSSASARSSSAPPPASAPGRSSSPSTWTGSTRHSRRERERRSRAG